MNRVKWKKLLGIILVVGALIFAFWYGGNAPGLQGFSFNDKDSNYTTETVVDNHTAGDDTVNDKQTATSNSKQTNQETSKKKEVSKDEKDSSGFFGKIVMKVRRLGSPKKKKAPQLNKRAQKNANKAVKKAGRTGTKTTNKKNHKSKKIASNNDNNVQNDNIDKTSDSKTNDSDNSKSDNKKNDDTQDNASTKTSDTNNNKSTDKDTSQTDKSADNSTEEAKTDKTEQEPEEDESGTITCTIYISCASVLNNMDKLSDATKKVIPEDGLMLDTYEVKVKPGSTVFDVLNKAARKNKLHLEYNYTPAYKTYYIEGIGNLYEFDAGNLSGWMYSVNDKFPGVGCSGYKVKDGDVIKFLYTCNFGKDVGSSFD